MSSVIRIVSALSLIGMPLAAPALLAAAPDETLRRSARLLVNVEALLEKRDLKGYCGAFYGSTDFAAYLARACELSVKNNLAKAEDCPQAIRQDIEKHTDRCLAMSDAEIERERLEQRRARESLVKSMGEKGMDGENILQEERARLR